MSKTGYGEDQVSNKPENCNTCGRIIPAGEYYRVNSLEIDDPNACAVCFDCISEVFKKQGMDDQECAEWKESQA